MKTEDVHLMNSKNSLTSGNPVSTLVKFALPFLLACFLQTFYGMVDMFAAGRYNGSETTAAVSIGSQIMHMITVMIVGFTMGITVMTGRAFGEKNNRKAAFTAGASAFYYMTASVAASVILFLLASPLAGIMQTPEPAFAETVKYLRVCLLGIPFITGYNIISSIFRGAGDSKRPMMFVAAACTVNIALDFIFVGGMKLGAFGAALATVSGQLVSVVYAFVYLVRKGAGVKITREHFRPDSEKFRPVFKVGFPVAMQDGLIQVAFIIITVIANRRGLTAATAVGIVERLIGFMFLVPSAMLSALSAITAQNMGAGNRERAGLTLRYGLIITSVYGIICCICNQIIPESFIGIFTKDADVLAAGCEYMKSYAFDCIFAGMHFCFSGYFCGDQKSHISFIHNIISIITVRIPGAYLASVWYADTLWPMGLAAPLGSLLSALICTGFYFWYRNKERQLS